SPGFLGSKHSPLVVNQDLLPADVRVEAATPDADTPLLRLSARRDLLRHLDDQRRALDRTAEGRGLDTYRQRAFNLLSSPATAEFGRTPRVNSAGGRDHWPWVYSVALAGGGTAGGVVYGASDKVAAYPTARPHDPRDLAATVYHLLGVPPETQVHDALGRP